MTGAIFFNKWGNVEIDTYTGRRVCEHKNGQLQDTDRGLEQTFLCLHPAKEPTSQHLDSRLLASRPVSQ